MYIFTGEYITLYQKQRAVLGERWNERDQTFRKLVDQRNQQQEQLHKLKILVTELLEKHPETLISSTETCMDYHKSKYLIYLIQKNFFNFEIMFKMHIHIYVYLLFLTEINVDDPALSEDKKQENAELPLIEDKTTSEILDLLTEIKDCKDTCIIEPNFHPCLWCSGRLINL